MPPVHDLLETAIYVRDLAASAAFYRTLFGFETLLESDRLIALDVSGRSVLLLFQRRERAHALCVLHRQERGRRVEAAPRGQRRRRGERSLVALRRAQRVFPRPRRAPGRIADAGVLANLLS
jgi:catechol 2,3-dioxygenase-like lactoylglutathione lyase family enzyme